MPESTELDPRAAEVGRPEASRPRLRPAVRSIWGEVSRFGLIGALAFIIDLGGMNLLVHTVLSDKVTTARILSGVTATLFAWLGNRNWTFAHRRSLSMRRELVFFFIVNGLALAISTLTLVISHYGLDFTSRWADNLATIFGIGLGTLFRFWAYRRFVFGRDTR